jgi:hypothetical protein
VGTAASYSVAQRNAPWQKLTRRKGVGILCTHWAWLYTTSWDIRGRKVFRSPPAMYQIVPMDQVQWRRQPIERMLKFVPTQAMDPMEGEAWC